MILENGRQNIKPVYEWKSAWLGLDVNKAEVERGSREIAMMSMLSSISPPYSIIIITFTAFQLDPTLLVRSEQRSSTLPKLFLRVDIQVGAPVLLRFADIPALHQLLLSRQSKAGQRARRAQGKCCVFSSLRWFWCLLLLLCLKPSRDPLQPCQDPAKSR